MISNCKLLYSSTGVALQAAIELQKNSSTTPLERETTIRPDQAKLSASLMVLAGKKKKGLTDDSFWLQFNNS
ncbi:hypothetical protein SADUNF_Sadunf18G0033300 [Salix dunnii]|uniref:Uncharacterized protein n=1 Tax=Salix dunnii TaxID=1413687 RepID=A0A835J334_9ROSI|nr:hypothetical protein SADUNF_Sadunf18G0033300 [Salix dunnii]